MVTKYKRLGQEEKGFSANHASRGHGIWQKGAEPSTADEGLRFMLFEAVIADSQFYGHIRKVTQQKVGL